MADPLSAMQGRVPHRVQSAAANDDAETRRLRQLWSDIFPSPSAAASDRQSLRTRALKGDVPIGDRPTLRWIHWKLFLSEHLSSTPSSWTAVLDKDRSHYAALRRDMLRAPDGNYPPDLGLEDDEEVMAQMSSSRRDAASSSSSSRPALLSGSRSSSSRSQAFAGGRAIIGDLSVNNPLSLDDSNPWKTHYASLETRQTIAQDVQRTFPDVVLFREPRVQKGLANALFVWCGQNEDVGYRQGMHELLAVLWLVRQRDSVREKYEQKQRSGSGSVRDEQDVMRIVLSQRWIEHDVYTLFCILMQGAKSWFEWRVPEASQQQPTSAIPRTVSRGSSFSLAQQPSSSSSITPATPPIPIVARCERIRGLLHTTDPSLAQHLDTLGIEPQIFALRWIRLIFTREFPLEDALMLWDGLFAADPSLALVDYICVAMLMRVRNELLAADYSGALSTLLRYPSVDPKAAKEGDNRTELLVEQATYLRDNGSTPTSGVAVVLQNRDRLGTLPRFPDAGKGGSNIGSGDGSSPSRSPALSRETPYPPYLPRAASKFATVGRVPSGAHPVASWQRPAPAGSRQAAVSPRTYPQQQQPQQPQRRSDDPFSASTAGSNVGGSSAALPLSPSRSFGILPSAYIPEEISDFARGLYERSDSLGINRALNSTMVNVQRTVAAVAGSGPGSIAGNGGFPSSFNDSLAQSVSNASLSSLPANTAIAAASPPLQLAVPPRHASSAAATVGRASGLPASNAATASSSASVAELTAKLAGLTSTNKAIGAALSACVEVLETSWLSRREAETTTATSSGDGTKSAPSDELDQGDVDTLMSFTALKHIRDVLNDTAKEFDSATLPSKRTTTTAGKEATTASSSSSAFSGSGAAVASPSPSAASVHGATPDPSAVTRSGVAHEEAGQHRPLVTAGAPVQITSTASHYTAGLPMSLPEYQRYGRQMILADFGLKGQLRLRRSKVLVVGAGGLGCPAIQYLAAAGVGQITILDHDSVEASNLARQILHTDAKIGVNKAESAAQAARTINPFVTVIARPVGISSANARSMIAGHDLVLDCTDNPLTRYLISDAAVLEGVEVVSGAAQGYDGQLIVLHKKILPQFAAKPPATAAPPSTGDNLRGPCYRCLFPVAPKPEDVTDCEDGGVLGGITGLVGTMQALESVKLLARIGEATPPTMTLVSPMGGTAFRSIKLRPRRTASCRSCGDPDQVGRGEMITDLEREDYVTFCHLRREEVGDDTKKAAVKRVTVQEMERAAGKRLVVDVRPPVEFGITRIEGSINLPYKTLVKDPSGALEMIRSHLSPSSSSPPLLVCRKGNDSQLAVRLLQRAIRDQQAARADEERVKETVNHDPLSTPETRTVRPEEIEFSDLVGGLRAYAGVKQGFPMY